MRWTAAVLGPEIWRGGDSPVLAFDEMQRGGGGGCHADVRRGENMAAAVTSVL
jgi:hypothetical protein